MTVRFSDYLNEQTQNEDFRREYELAEFEYSLSQAIKEAREAEGLTQKQLARKAGIKPSDLRKIEDFQTSPSLDILQQLARGLDKKLRLEFQPTT